MNANDDMAPTKIKKEKNIINKINKNDKIIQIKEQEILKNDKNSISSINRRILTNDYIDWTNNRINNNEIKKYLEILQYNDYELNSLIYKEALIRDKRNFLQYYLSLLRTNHLLIFSFYCNNKDYNIQIIKIFLFFFFFSVQFFINALFFNDNTMHKILIDEGSYNFIYQIPQIIYSCLISGFINAFIKYLSLSEKEIVRFKEEKKIEEKIMDEKKLISILKIKFILFFIITFFLLFLFTYYISCFCGIYINTQIHLIKDTVISFGLSLIYPFGIYLIPGMLEFLL